MTKLPVPACETGYTKRQIDEILGERSMEFWKWMNGQTMCLCQGRIWRHATAIKDGFYEPCCGGTSHGTVVYPWDLKRFMDGKPVID